MIDESHNLANAAHAEQPARPAAVAQHRGVDPGLGNPAQRPGRVVRRTGPAARPVGGAAGRSARSGGGRSDWWSAGTGTARRWPAWSARTGPSATSRATCWYPHAPPRTRSPRELEHTWLWPARGRGPYSGQNSSLFPWTLAKAFLSSPAALRETITERRRPARHDRRHGSGAGRAGPAGDAGRRAPAQPSAKYDALVEYLREHRGRRRDADAAPWSSPSGSPPSTGCAVGCRRTWACRRCRADHARRAVR